MDALATRLLWRSPAIVRRQALLLLFRATAAGFQREMPALRGYSREECLLAYARFTAEQAEEALRRPGDLRTVQERLYANAYRLGRLQGRVLRVRGMDDVMATGRLLYSILDIDLEGDDNGEITIRRCYFSAFYSPDVCKVMSAMDRGLFAGLACGGELVFVERMTEGCACCRARFRMGQRPDAPRTEQEQTT